MPKRDLIDLLKRVQSWIPYTRHFGPPSGASSKLKEEVYKYIFTIFGFGCNLGAKQTVRHTQGTLTARILRRINKQHIDSDKIDAAIRDIINNYNRWELTNYWGDGKWRVSIIFLIGLLLVVNMRTLSPILSCCTMLLI